MEQLFANLSRAVEAPASRVHFDVGLPAASWWQRFVSSRRCRALDKLPMRPNNADSGSTARNPRRISEAALRPLVGNSGSSGAMILSKSSTRWWSWVLMPQTKKSSKGGRRQSRATGRFLICPSACGSGARAMSPSSMGADRRRCIPARRHRTRGTIAARPDVTMLRAPRSPVKQRPPVAHWPAAGTARRVEFFRRQNGRSKPQWSYSVNPAAGAHSRNREVREL